MKKLFFAIPAVMALTACTPAMDITSEPVNVTFTNSAASQGILGYEAITVRAYNKVDGTRTELAGVKCTFKGSGFGGNVVTPGIVNLPDYGDQSRPVTFTCNNGTTTEIAQAIPFNATSAAMMNNSHQGGLLGVLVVATIDAARDKANDDWSYRPVTVQFE